MLWLSAVWRFVDHRVTPAPASSPRVIRLVAARHLRGDKAVGRTELGCDLNLAQDGLRQHPRSALLWLVPHQRHIGEFLVLEREVYALDLLMRTGARQALGEVTPVR